MPKIGLIRCANMKWIRLVLWKIQSRNCFVHRRTDRQTDRQTDDVKPVYPPFNFVKAGGIMNYPDQMLSTSWYWLWWKRYTGYLFLVLIFKMVPVHGQWHFIFDWWMGVLSWEIAIFGDKNVSLQGVSTQDLSIHAEYSAIWSGFWTILVPDRIKSVQNTMSQRTGLVIL